MFKIVEEVNAYLKTLQNFGMDNLHVLNNTAMQIAGLGAVILVLVISVNLYFGKRINMQKLGKILIIFLILTMYGPLLGLINGTLDQVNHICKSAFASEVDLNVVYQDLWEKKTKAQSANDGEAESNAFLKEILKEIEKENPLHNESNKIGTDLILAFNHNNVGEFKHALITTFEEFMLMLSAGSIVILNIIRTTFLIILSVIGLFAIALSIIPALENSGYAWLQKYVQTYLWLGITYIVEGVTSLILQKYNETVHQDIVSTTFDLLLMLVCFSTLILVCLVPIITRHIVSTTVSYAYKLSSDR
ncbi:MAG: hypothetical protein ACK5HU_03290 [Flavobacteriales bacterium]